MSYDPDLDPIFAALRDADAALAQRLDGIAARLDRLETAPPAPAPEPQPAATMNRQLIGLAIPDGEMMTNTAAKIARIKALGVTAVRMDYRIENIRRNGLAHYAGVTDALRRADIDVLAILGGNDKVANQEAQEAFATHAAETVAWLAQRGIYHIQFWNEPNHATRVMQPEHYARAIRLAYPAVKAANPDVFCVAAGLSAINDSVNGHISTTDWLTRCYAAGAKGHYDALAVHPYSYPFDLYGGEDWTGWGNLVKRMRPVMEANGEGHLKIWATEAGFPTSGGASGNTEANQKAMYADKLLAEMRKLTWLGPVFHYGLDDRGGSTTDAENWFGLYRPDGSAKPAAAPMRAAIATLNSGA